MTKTQRARMVQALEKVVDHLMTAEGLLFEAFRPIPRNETTEKDERILHMIAEARVFAQAEAARLAEVMKKLSS